MEGRSQKEKLITRWKEWTKEGATAGTRQGISRANIFTKQTLSPSQPSHLFFDRSIFILRPCVTMESIYPDIDIFTGSNNQASSEEQANTTMADSSSNADVAAADATIDAGTAAHSFTGTSLDATMEANGQEAMTLHESGPQDMDMLMGTGIMPIDQPSNDALQPPIETIVPHEHAVPQAHFNPMHQVPAGVLYFLPHTHAVAQANLNPAHQGQTPPAGVLFLLTLI